MTLIHSLTILISTFVASLIFIFFKAFQQRNVAFDNYFAVIPTSILMAFAEFYVIANFIKEGYSFDIIMAIGLGSGLGAIIAMWSHKKWMINPKSGGKSAA